MEREFQPVDTKEPAETKHDYEPKEIWRIWKNVLVIGFSFMLHFTAFWGASNLQSSVNTSGSLGTFTLAAIYASLLLSNIFLPVMVIRWLGGKWTIALSFIAYMPFIMAQFYPEFYTMIPAGLAVGFGGGPLWCAKCTYLTVIAEAYAQITRTASDIVVTRFFGIFFMFYQFSQVWGNLISSAVLSSAIASATDNAASINSTIQMLTTTVEPSSISPLERDYSLCGPSFDPQSVLEVDSPNFEPPDRSKINIVYGIYLACMIGACLIVIFGVDSMNRYGKGREGSGSGISGFKLLIVTLRQLSNPFQLLILPITMFIGAEQAFIAADFTVDNTTRHEIGFFLFNEESKVIFETSGGTLAYVTCGWGVNNIGFVMICFGVCNGLASIFVGSIIKITGRSPVICFALSLHVALIVTLLVWQPNPASKMMFFVLAALWGVCDAIWLVQINSLSGILFPGKEEASYSNFRLWESTGSVITYAYSPYLSTNVKLFLLLGLLLIGVSGYTAAEYMQYVRTKSKFNLLDDKNYKMKEKGVAE